MGAERPKSLVFIPPCTSIFYLTCRIYYQEVCVNKSKSTADVREKELLITVISQLSNCPTDNFRTYISGIFPAYKGMFSYLKMRT